MRAGVCFETRDLTRANYSMRILERNALSQRYKEEPEAVLVELNSGLGKVDKRGRLFGGTGQRELR
jgi:hypothetical protein